MRITKSIWKLLLSAAILLVVIGFAGCDLVGNSAELDASSRKAAAAPKAGPKTFSATVMMTQVLGSVDTTNMGNSNHKRAENEQLFSGYIDYDTGSAVFTPISSPEWDLLDGAYATMENTTNYNLDLDLQTFQGTGELNGSNHSVIYITTGPGGTGNLNMTMQANGTIVGNFFTGATLSMNWVAGNVPEKIKASGTITGTFFWFDLSTGSPVQIVPYGLFTITGRYL